MPLLTQERAIKEYYETVKDKYPGISFERFSEICKAPGNFIKQCIKGEHLPRILVKYIGRFRVFPSKIKKQLENEEAYFKRGITTEEYYNQRVKFLGTYLEKLNKEINEKRDHDDCEEGETTD